MLHFFLRLPLVQAVWKGVKLRHKARLYCHHCAWCQTIELHYGTRQCPGTMQYTLRTGIRCPGRRQDGNTSTDFIGYDKSEK